MNLPPPGSRTVSPRASPLPTPPSSSDSSPRSEKNKQDGSASASTSSHHISKRLANGMPAIPRTLPKIPSPAHSKPAARPNFDASFGMSRFVADERDASPRSPVTAQHSWSIKPQGEGARKLLGGTQRKQNATTSPTRPALTDVAAAVSATQGPPLHDAEPGAPGRDDAAPAVVATHDVLLSAFLPPRSTRMPALPLPPTIKKGEKEADRNVMASPSGRMAGDDLQRSKPQGTPTSPAERSNWSRPQAQPAIAADKPAKPVKFANARSVRGELIAGFMTLMTRAVASTDQKIAFLRDDNTFTRAFADAFRYTQHDATDNLQRIQDRLNGPGTPAERRLQAAVTVLDTLKAKVFSNPAWIELNKTFLDLLDADPVLALNDEKREHLKLATLTGLLLRVLGPLTSSAMLLQGADRRAVSDAVRLATSIINCTAGSYLAKTNAEAEKDPLVAVDIAVLKLMDETAAFYNATFGLALPTSITADYLASLG